MTAFRGQQKGKPGGQCRPPRTPRLSLGKVKPRIRLVFAIVAANLVGVCVASAHTKTISLRAALLPHGYRVVSLDLHVEFGHMMSIEGVPEGWRLVIDNDPGGRFRLSGDIGVGAAALDRSNLAALAIDFVPDSELRCSGSINFTRDFDHVLTRQLTDSDCAIDALARRQ
jgi:hypothetical protein